MTRPSLNLGSGGTGDLTEQLARERDRAEELNNRLTKSAKDLGDAGRREAELRSDLGRKEKDLALIKHEVKELQRRAEQVLMSTT